jgi:hypothetical protein
MRYGYLILASDTVPGVIRVRIPQTVAPDLGERVVGVAVAEPAAPSLHAGEDPDQRMADVLHLYPRRAKGMRR